MHRCPESNLNGGSGVREENAEKQAGRSEGFPEWRILSLGALLGWVVRDFVFLVASVSVVSVSVGRGGAAARDPSCYRSNEATRG